MYDVRKREESWHSDMRIYEVVTAACGDTKGRKGGRAYTGTTDRSPEWLFTVTKKSTIPQKNRETLPLTTSFLPPGKTTHLPSRVKPLSHSHLTPPAHPILSPPHAYISYRPLSPNSSITQRDRGPWPTRQHPSAKRRNKFPISEPINPIHVGK